MEPEMNNSFSTCEDSKNKQDNTFCRDLFVFISGLFVIISEENNIPSLRSQSWDIAPYPEIANQSNCAILGGLHAAYPNLFLIFYITHLELE